MPTTYLFAISTTTVTLGTMPIYIEEGRAYAADDPVVVRYPDLFSDTPMVYDHFNNPITPAGYNPVEQATAAPGEKRPVRRG